MKRRHLFELSEQRWYPNAWRRLCQSTVGTLSTRAGIYKSMAGPFSEMLDRVGASSIVDLCTGASAPVLQMCDEVVRYRPGLPRIRVLLSDVTPNLPHLIGLKERHAQVDFCPYPVDAKQVPNESSVPRVRTAFAALHRFRPEEVREMLFDAAKNADGVAIFEMAARRWRNLALAAAVPAAAMLTTSFLLRPWHPKQLLLGSFVPVIPWTLAFDGLVSNLRAYTPEELEDIVASIDAPDFEWKVGTVPLGRTGLRGTYVLGWRRSVAAARRREQIKSAAT